jgi:hypothetical protein
MEPDPIPHLDDYLEAPFPCAHDIAVLHRVIRFSHADKAVRSQICDAVTPLQIDLLLQFAQRMAQVSIVRHRLRLAEAGLVALVIAGDKANAHSVWHMIAKLHKSISALTASPERVFRRVVDLAGASAAGPLLEGFLCRDSDGRVV